MEMKNIVKKFCGFSVGIIAVLTLIIICFYKFISMPDILIENVILESSYINYAWGFQYNGKVICDSGNIYSFSKSDMAAYVSASTDLETLNNYILSGDTKFVGRVNDKDLKTMKEYAKTIDNNYTEASSGGNDMGANVISIWDYDKNEKTLLKETGDWNKENTSENAKKLNELIEKYMK